MFRPTELITRLLERAHHHRPPTLPPHLLVAQRGEREAYLFLRRLGYRIVATNFRLPQSRGELDLVAWDGDVLCFVEVKTRVRQGLTPPEAAVDWAKRSHLLDVARRYLRRVPGDRPPSSRFDVVSVLLGDNAEAPVIELHRGAFTWETDRPERRPFRESRDRRRWGYR